MERDDGSQGSLARTRVRAKDCREGSLYLVIPRPHLSPPRPPPPHYPDPASSHSSLLGLCHRPKQSQGSGCRPALEVISAMPPASTHSPAHHAPPQRPPGAEFSSHIGDLTLFPFCASGAHRRDHQEAAQQHPAEHGDRHRGGDAQSGHAPGQPGVHGREHQQQQL